jgi:hypothetical protein
MTPQSDLASTGYCLAAPGTEYLIYQPVGSSFSVTVESGTYSVEWLNSGSGSVTTGGSVQGGKTINFTSPFEGPAVLYLKATQRDRATPDH